MEEVDQIIIHALKSIGCDLDDDVRSVSEFDSKMLFSSVVRCMQVIEPEKELKTESFGKGMSGRVSACASVAQAVKESGYRGDLGYHQLLYPNSSETRALLNFLTSKLPRTEQEQSSDSAETATDSSELLQKEMEAKFASQLKDTWSPFSDPYSSQHIHQSKNALFTSSIESIFENDNADFITRQPSRRIDVAPSIMEYNFAQLIDEIQRKEEWESQGLESGLNPTQFRNQKRARIVRQMGERIRFSLEESEAAFAAYAGEQEKEKASRLRKANRFTNLVDYTQEETSYTPQESEEDVTKRREEELATLEEQINNLKLRLEQVKKDMENFQTGIRQGEAQIVLEDQKFESLKERYRIDKKVFEELLPDAANNIKLLQEISQKSAAQLMELAEEWEKHRSKLIEAYRKLKAQHINRKGGTAELLVNIKAMRSQMKDLEIETSKKDERYKELLEVYSQLPKNINRSVYTNRILEIVKQVKKQKVDIEKILLDTRNLQKEINANIETLGRTFTLANEVIYIDAKNEKKGENSCKRAFKSLVTIHEKYKAISDKVSELGGITNQVLDLGDKLSQATQRAGDLDLERVENDLNEVKKENRELMKKLTQS